MSVRQRLLVGVCVAAAVLALAVGLGTMSSASASSCGTPCGGGAASVSAPSRPQSVPCVRDIGCSGGFALASASGVAVVSLVPLALALVLPFVWRRRRLSMNGLLGRVPATGLFRPPRPLLDA